MKHLHGESTRAAPDSLLFSLLGAAHALEARIEETLGSIGLSMAKQGVLSLLADNGEPMSLSDLAARQQCVRSNITQLVDRLEADGLVRRIADPADRRSVRAQLTPQGEDRQTAGAARVEIVQAAFMAALPPADRSALERILSGLG
jgi:DNA-binding MarR family transcriptional regulator